MTAILAALPWRGPFDFWDALLHPWGQIQCGPCWGQEELPDSYKGYWVKVWRWGGVVRAMKRHARLHERLDRRKVTQ